VLDLSGIFVIEDVSLLGWKLGKSLGRVSNGKAARHDLEGVVGTLIGTLDRTFIRIVGVAHLERGRQEKKSELKLLNSI
jgi:hypothetical protein